MATGLTAAQIGDLATDRCLTVHELSPLRGSLEDAFMELTHDAVEFEAHAHSHSSLSLVAPPVAPRSLPKNERERKRWS